MRYDRAQVKLQAKAALRQAQPKPQLVTLVYCLLVYAIPVALLITVMRPVFNLMILSVTDVSEDTLLWYLSTLSPGTILLNLFLGILILLFTMVIGFGYSAYAMGVNRGLPSAYGTLFTGLSMVGKVLSLQLWVILFSVLWGILGLFVMVILLYVLLNLFVGLLYSAPYLIYVFSYALVGAFLAFYLNRILRYILCDYILLDHPDWTPLEALTESKAQMEGRRWSYVVLTLSFLGWTLLCQLIFSAVAAAGGYLAGGFFQFSIGGAFPLYLFAHLHLLPALGILILAALCAAPLFLWLAPYLQCATVGFYDVGSGFYPLSGTDAPPPVSNPGFCQGPELPS